MLLRQLEEIVWALARESWRKTCKCSHYVIVSEGSFWDFTLFLGFIVPLETEPFPTQDLKPQTVEASLYHLPTHTPSFFLNSGNSLVDPMICKHLDTSSHVVVSLF